MKSVCAILLLLVAHGAALAQSYPNRPIHLVLGFAPGGAADYVARVVSGRIVGPTLSFQLREGFRVIAVVPDYLRHDPESLGYAAVIEWLRHADAPTARTAPSVPPLVRPRPAA